MKVAVLKETFPGERRVALVPGAIGPLLKSGLEVVVESAAGQAAGSPDDAYRAAGATIVSRDEAFAADCLLTVRTCGANAAGWAADRDRLRPGVILIGLCDPLSTPGPSLEAAERGATVFALELVPRITRAQSMDVLSSQANIAGYRAVLLAANTLPHLPDDDHGRRHGDSGQGARARRRRRRPPGNRHRQAARCAGERL
jgi:NAD(P) transhydrogenase subunit alpha